MVALDVRSISASGPRLSRPRRNAPRHRRKRGLERRWRSGHGQSIFGAAGPVAQRIEHRFPKPGVAGSSPAGVAKFAELCSRHTYPAFGRKLPRLIGLTHNTVDNSQIGTGNTTFGRSIAI